jgi:6-phosphogluconolactonase
MVDRTGRYLFVPTFHGATVHVFPIEPDGRLGPTRDDHRHKGSSVHPRRQTGPHPHSITLDPANRFALVPDLGTDRVVVYELDLERGRLVPHPERDARVAPGSGPRHLTFHPSAPFGYLVNEMAATVTVFAYDPTTGTPSEIQTVPTRAAGATGLRSAAAIAVHPSGRFLYCTNRSHGSSGEPPERGEDSIAWLAIDAATGRLTPCGRVRTQGEIPRAIAIDREGARLYVASQARSIIEAFRIDAGSGEPAPTGQVTSTPVPACLQLALL